MADFINHICTLHAIGLVLINKHNNVRFFISGDANEC